MADAWYCKIGEQEFGPLTAHQVKEMAASGQLLPTHLVRVGDQGPWNLASHLHGAKFGSSAQLGIAASQPQGAHDNCDAWYCKIGDREVGPLTAQQVKHLADNGQLLPSHFVRHGARHAWVPAGLLKGGTFVVGMQDLKTHPDIPVRSDTSVEAPAPSENPPDLRDLQQVVDYRLVQKSRWGGFASIFFGLIAIASGVRGLQDNPANSVLALIGVFLIIEGTWLISNPAPILIVIDGCAMCVVGAWNIFVYLSAFDAGIAQEGVGRAECFAALGLAQIGWGIQGFRRYARLSKWPPKAPSADDLQRIQQIVDEVRNATMMEDANIIDVKVYTFPFEQQWKGRLGDTYAVFLGASGPDIIFARKDDVVLTDRRLFGCSRLRIAGRRFKVTTPRETIERYKRWKEAPKELDALPPIMAPTSSLPRMTQPDSPTVVLRRPWLAYAGLCVAIAFFLLPSIEFAIETFAALSGSTFVSLGSLIGIAIKLVGLCFLACFAYWLLDKFVLNRNIPVGINRTLGWAAGSAVGASLVLSFLCMLVPGLMAAKEVARRQAQAAAGPKPAARIIVIDGGPALSDESCMELALSLEHTVASGQATEVETRVDWEAILEAGTSGIQASEKSRFDFGEAAKKGLATSLAQNVVLGGSYKLLHLHRKEGRPLALFRLMTVDGSINYHDWSLARCSDENVRLIDGFIFSTGEKISETLRREFIGVAGHESQESLERLQGKDSAYFACISQLEKIANDAEAGRNRDVLRALHELPDELQQEKIVLLLRLRTAQRLGDDDEYAVAATDFKNHSDYPAAVELICIDDYMLKKEYARALDSIDRVDTQVGGDPYLNVLRANMRIEMGELDAAQALAAQAIELDPTLVSAYWPAVTVSLKQKAFEKTLQLLETVDKQFKWKFPDLTTIPEFAEFVKSPQYGQWVSTHPVGDSQTPPE